MSNQGHDASAVSQSRFVVVWNHSVRFLSHPITALLAGLIVSLILYLVSRAVKEPVFAVDRPQPLAQTVNEEARLRLFWDQDEIKNAVAVKIAIWNNGADFIDKADISTTTPIRIECSSNVNILSVNLLKASRGNLKFETKKLVDSNGVQTILVNLLGDEALEKYDGAIFQILFSGSVESVWKVTGRVKGVPSGFNKKEWPKARDKKDTIFIIALGSFFLLMGSSFLISEIRVSKLRNLPTDPFDVIVFGAMPFLAILVIGWIVVSNLWVPAWLT